MMDATLTSWAHWLLAAAIFMVVFWRALGMDHTTPAAVKVKHGLVLLLTLASVPGMFNESLLLGAALGVAMGFDCRRHVVRRETWSESRWSAR